MGSAHDCLTLSSDNDCGWMLKIDKVVFSPFIDFVMERCATSIVTFFSFISLWNSYQLPKVLLNDPMHSTLPMGVELLFGNGTAIVGVMMLVPAVGLYLLSQRSIERGIFSGAVKG